MPPLAEKIVVADVILSAAEQRGGHDIVIVGYDVGGMVAYAAARDHTDRLCGAVVMNTVIPGIDPWKKILSNPPIWHFAFHNIPELPERLVSGRERPYFDFFYDVMAGNKSALSDTAREAYAEDTVDPRHSRRDLIGTGRWPKTRSAIGSGRRSTSRCSICEAAPTAGQPTSTWKACEPRAPAIFGEACSHVLENMRLKRCPMLWCPL